MFSTSRISQMIGVCMATAPPSLRYASGRGAGARRAGWRSAPPGHPRKDGDAPWFGRERIKEKDFHKDGFMCSYPVSE